MQYLVRHRITKRFITSGHVNGIAQDNNGMVPLEGARLFPTIKGASSAAKYQSDLITATAPAFGRPLLDIADLEVLEATIQVGAVVKSF